MVEGEQFNMRGVRGEGRGGGGGEVNKGFANVGVVMIPGRPYLRFPNTQGRSTVYSGRLQPSYLDFKENKSCL